MTTEETLNRAIGKTITAASIHNNKFGEEALHLSLSDGSGVMIFDNGQRCCETRYMTCDDDLSKLIGDKFMGIEVKPGPGSNDFEVKESIFVEVKTNGPGVTLCNHNEHNGYYGGFSVVVQEVVK